MSVSKKIGFGMRGALPSDAEESRIIPFILSTPQKDRHGTILNQSAWELDNYKLNPIVAYQHNLSGGMCTDPTPDSIIGKSIKIGTEGRGNDKILVAEAQFEEAAMNPLAEKVFRKILFGSMSRSSVGFLEVGHGQYGINEEAQGQPGETYYFTGQELLEWSVVNIPSNPGAGKRDMMRKMREEGYAVLMYAFKELGGNFRLSQIEQMRVCDILDLLDGKDLELKTKDPEEVAELIADPQAQKDTADMIARHQEYRKNVVNSR
jgi:hypothetical protein